MDDYIANKKKSELFALIKNSKVKEKEVFFHLLNRFINKYQDNEIQKNFFSQKLILINSFDHNDSNYLSHFLSFYFDNCQISHLNCSLSDAIAKDLTDLGLSHFPSRIDFDQIVQYSNFFFQSLLIDQEDKLLLLKTSSAFFETNQKNYFISPNLSLTYFFIHQNPLYIYNHLKEKHSSSQEALNEMFNFQNSLVSQQLINSKYKVLENRQSWNIHTNSWIDPNVHNTYRGLNICQQDFFSDPHNTLTRAIFHLIQSGIKFEVNYNLIDQFIKENPPHALKSYPDLSNKEKKILLNNLDQNLLDLLNYQI
jgi:hypothetical protein